MTITEAQPERTVLGQRLLRKEDPALLTGEARYTNDLAVPGALHLAVLRSPYASATINSVDVSAGAVRARRRGRLHAAPTSPISGPARCRARGRSRPT